MSMSTPGVSASFQVAFVSNLMERLYKDSDHKITHAENLQNLITDKSVLELSKAALNTPGLQLTDAQKKAASATVTLYNKKTNFDLLFENIFASDKNVNIGEVREKFGDDVDKKIFGGVTLDKVISMGNALTKSGNLDMKKALDFWIHGQGSHEGDLVGSDGKRIGATSLLQNVDPKTGLPVETVEEAKARSDSATAKAAPIDPLSSNLPTRKAFQAELDKETQGKMDMLFITSDMNGHKAKGDFIQQVLIDQMGATNVKSAADNNWTISANAAGLKAKYADIAGNDPLLSRQTGATYFKKHS